MGLSEGLQHSESPRIVAQSSVSLDEEKLGRLSPKYKKRRVSCVRDFPPGCGPFAHLNNSRPVQEVPSIPSTVKYYPRRIVEAVRDFPPLCGRNAFLEAKNLNQDESVMGDKSFSSITTKTSVEYTQVGDKVQPTTEKKRPREDPLDSSCQINQLHGKAFESSELASRRLVVLGLMASSNNQLHKGGSINQLHTEGSNNQLHKEDSNNQLSKEDFKSWKLTSHRVVVLGSMAASNSLCMKRRRGVQA